jgi:hypothetical protein
MYRSGALSYIDFICARECKRRRQLPKKRGGGARLSLLRPAPLSLARSPGRDRVALHVTAGTWRPRGDVTSRDPSVTSPSRKARVAGRARGSGRVRSTFRRCTPHNTRTLARSAATKLRSRRAPFIYFDSLSTPGVEAQRRNQHTEPLAPMSVDACRPQNG